MEYDKLFPAPPGMESRSVLSRRHSCTSQQPHYIRIAPPSGVSRSSVPLALPVSPESKEPITSSIFSALALNPDDPAIVRFANSGEITAATPARIIAQITSKSTVDYELVSDFFLTFRSYLSSYDLLAYLLARFHWAINRFDDDGRVIRVRVFAAIRHWILNYFVYDFVVDRDLRIQFCNKVNDIGREVCGRTSRIASDIKLIVDLKKCWNGRCALYWDSPEFQNDGHAETDIIPGGIAGSRDSQLSHPSQMNRRVIDVRSPQIGAVVAGEDTKASLHNWFEDIAKDGHDKGLNHKQQASVASAHIFPTSPTREQSVHITSCSVPARGFKKSMPVSSRAVGSHPVPGELLTPERPKRVCAGHCHKRSGSFSDALRDHRSPLPAAKVELHQVQPQMAYLYAGSLIRGNLFLPGLPYVDTVAPTTPITELPSVHPCKIGIDGTLAATLKPNGATNPGMRTLFGSIRRALSTKQSNSNHASTTEVNVRSAPSLAGKSSTLLASMSYRGEERRKLKGTGFRGHLRVDALADKIAGSFKKALEENTYGDVRPESIGIAYDNEHSQPSPEASSPTGHAVPIDHYRQPSQVTMGSRSIIMMDGIGPDLPLMSGALSAHSVAPTLEEKSDPLTLALSTTSPPHIDEMVHQFDQRHQEKNSIDRAGGSLKLDHTGRPDSRLVQADSSARSLKVSRGDCLEPSVPTRGKSFRSTRSGTLSLRRCESLQSGMTRRVLGPSFHASAASDTSADCTNGAFDRAPAHMLRRRPGGDLRAIQNVHTLEQPPRPRSTGSITTYSDSMNGSALYMTTRRSPGGAATARFSTARHSNSTSTVAAGSVREPVSMMQSRSSQPPLRPSFEAAIIEFSNIPDDADGGIESTLLKLEGRYEPGGSQKSLELPVDQEANIGNDHQPTRDLDTLKPPSSHETVTEDTSFVTPKPLLDQQPSHPPRGIAPGTSGMSRLRGQSPVHRLPRSPTGQSEDSYNSTPLLERGLSNRFMKRRTPNQKWSKISMPRPLFSPTQSAAGTGPDSSDPSIDYVEETDSIRKITQNAPFAQRSPTTDSFLLDEDEYLSDLSSEISMEVIDREETMDRYFKPALQFSPNSLASGTGTFSHPLRHPPSPPMTMENALSPKPHSSHMPFQFRLPTPDPSPTSRTVQHNMDLPKSRLGPDPSLGNVYETTFKALGVPEHQPFIIAYESEALAQQFTIIEEDALSEIDWKDLVDMSWHHTSPTCLNWVEYLRTEEPKGIDIVTARFNVMVKWALSEIVLTRDIDERARTITKYIHVAHHARKCHNYATMFQLTIALTSIDCTRLTRTWERVPYAEKQILKELESLIQPMRNFHNLRMEMETANAEEGCIPVLALYIHDLTYNAQKPSQIAGTGDGEPLVNFERYRTAASIVKSLLRLIDASTKYTYQPVEGLIERCLWMAALPDEKIRILSKEIE
ncbi:MAG: Guanine nucleotide exchange factor lte1 [Pleopsidium flavum]|nr:MAG: Guanine nucleotide exchange factor lte1 [Pleopsidium flavum]